jgi:putative tryptophan/tyrosine transport system substrate-binding protein
MSIVAGKGSGMQQHKQRLTSRRQVASIAAATLLGWLTQARAQPSGKALRVGFLAGNPRPPDGAIPAPLRNALGALGYTEGKDIAYEGRWGEVRNERLPALAAELVALKVDVIVTFGAPSAAAAKQATSSIPIVVIFAGDTVETGLVASLSRPGGNVTGINDPAAILSAKRLELVKELVPAVKRVAVLWNMGDNAMTLRYREIERAARVLGVNIDPLGVREPDDFDAALAALNRSRPDALMMVSDALTTLNRKRVVDYVAQNRIPAVYEFPNAVQSGGLMSYGTDPGENFKLAADYVARILKGANPIDLPVQQPNRYYLVVNQITAKALGIAVPKTLLLRADEVIQ